MNEARDIADIPAPDMQLLCSFLARWLVVHDRFTDAEVSEYLGALRVVEALGWETFYWDTVQMFADVRRQKDPGYEIPLERGASDDPAG